MTLDLEQVDVDGAVREAAAEVAGDTRLDFLRRGALALGGGAALAALLPGTALAAKEIGAPPKTYGPGDTGILNYALALEYLESAFYDAAAKHGLAANDRMLTAYLQTAQRDEAYHVQLLKTALSDKARKQPSFDFGKAVTDKDTFAATAYELENTGVHAYLGQLSNFSNPRHQVVASEIVTVEARHAGAIGLYLGKPIAPAPLDSGETAGAVLHFINTQHLIRSAPPA